MDHGIEGMDAHAIYHIKGNVIWALGPKAKHEIMRGQWGRELKDVNLQELLKLFKKTFMPARYVFHSRAQFFNVKEEDGETLDEYWKRLVEIERKCEFNRITPGKLSRTILHQQSMTERPGTNSSKAIRNTDCPRNHRTRQLQLQVRRQKTEK